MGWLGLRLTCISNSYILEDVVVKHPISHLDSLQRSLEVDSDSGSKRINYYLLINFYKCCSLNRTHKKGGACRLTSRSIIIKENAARLHGSIKYHKEPRG